MHVTHTRAGAPSWGRALASAGLVIYVGNHQGMPCTAGLSGLNQNACDAPCLLLWDLVESRREEGRFPERALLILVIWDRAAVAGPTVIEASSSIIVSICIHAPFYWVTFRPDRASQFRLGTGQQWQGPLSLKPHPPWLSSSAFMHDYFVPVSPITASQLRVTLDLRSGSDDDSGCSSSGRACCADVSCCIVVSICI